MHDRQTTERQRTLAQLAQEALDVQNACNLSGVALGFGQAMRDLRALENLDSVSIRTHPITVLWIDKLRDMVGSATTDEYSKAYAWAEQTAAPAYEARR